MKNQTPFHLINLRGLKQGALYWQEAWQRKWEAEGRMSMEALRVIIDDLLATGGTAEAGCKLIEEAGGNIVKALFLVELPELEGRKKLEKYNVESIISFDGH